TLSCMNRSAVARDRSPVRRGQERYLWSGALFIGNRNPVLQNKNPVNRGLQDPEDHSWSGRRFGAQKFHLPHFKEYQAFKEETDRHR
ncbi:hypothetical protein ACLOJK_014577, partial [Asimina triloba]